MNDTPIILDDFLNYIQTIKGKSINTVTEYQYDLRTFFRFLKIRYKIIKSDVDFNDIDISDIDINIIKRVTLQDLYSFISYVDKERNNKNNAKARKVASLRSFYNYLYSKVKLIEDNPTIDLEFPKTDSRHPVYLTLEESMNLLDVIDGEFKERDYAIITLFLNCGLRLSELVSIDIDRIKDDTLTVIGKGNKERTIYLNNSCIDSINKYLEVRPSKGVKDKKALFISRKNNRLSPKGVQYVVKKYLKKAGLDTDKYSPHKLRHTAATLMYKHGNVDIRALQQLLGHENVSTTQIYTHIDDERLRKAVKNNPLSQISMKKTT